MLKIETSVSNAFLALLLMLLSTTYLSATIIERNTGGSWNDVTAWTIDGIGCNCIPTTADTVVINSGIITINVSDVIISGLRIEAAASLYTLIFYDVTINGDYGLINEGFFNLNSTMTITSVNNYPIENNGELDIRGTIVIYSDQEFYNNGTIEINTDGVIKMDSIQNTGLYNGIGATLHNEGEISSEVYTLGNGISNRGQFTNTGVIKIKHALESAFFNGLMGTLTNLGSIEIDSCKSNGLRNSGTVENEETINIDNAVSDAILNLSNFTNNGDITIKNGGDNGLKDSGTFKNNKKLVIDSVANDAIYISDFTNNGLLSIGENIGRFGIYHHGGTFTNNDSILIIDVTSYGIDVSNGATFNNYASIVIDGSQDNGIVVANSNFFNFSQGEITIQNVTTYGIRNTGSALFDNTGKVTLVDNSIDYSIFNENNFVNNKCGSVHCNDGIFNGSTFINHSYLFQEFSGVNINTGTFNNNGVISDIKNSFSGILTSNNGSLLTSIPGSHCQDDVIPNLIDGAKMGTIVIPESIFTDPEFTNLAGTYDIGANSWTPNSEAAYRDTFFIRLDLLGCNVAAEFRMDNVIAPLWYPDVDADGYGDAAILGTCSISMPTNYVRNNVDCDDGNNTIYPGAPELCDGLDNDCSGSAETLTIIWTGNGDATYWSDPINWDGLNVPAACQIVEIPGGFAPIIDPLVNGVALQVNIFSTASLSISATGMLHIDGMNNYSTLINNGVFSNSGKLQLVNSLGDALFNNGTFQNIDTISISKSSESAIENTGIAVLDNSGLIDIYNDFPADVIYNEGEITNGPGAKISIKDNPSKSTGIFNTSVSGSPGQVTNNGDIEINGVEFGIKQNTTSSPIVNASQGKIQIFNCLQAGISDGDITNSGEIEIENTGTYGFDNAGLSNSGKVYINQTGSAAILLKGITSNSGSISISNANIGLEFSNSYYLNSGDINIDKTINEGIIIDLTSTFDNQGACHISNTNQTGILLQGNLNNSDSLTLSKNIKGNGVLIDGGTMDNQNNGIFIIKNTDLNSIYISSGDFINAGYTDVNDAIGDGINTGGGTLISNTGEFKINDGILGYGINGAAINFVNQATGIISGNGLIFAPILSDQGTISPGDSPGKIILDGAYSQVNSTYLVDIEGISGEGVSGGHDIIDSNAPITLGGNLDVQFINGFIPCPGDEWVLMKSTTPISGIFGTVTLPPGYCLSLIYNTHDVRITIPGPPNSNWNGSISDDWFDPNNWNEGCVPGPESNVFIHPSPIYPIIVNKNARSKSIQFYSGTYLEIKTGFKLNVEGN